MFTIREIFLTKEAKRLNKIYKQALLGGEAAV